MRKVPAMGLMAAAVFGLAVVVMSSATLQTVEARPQYCKQFKEKYGDKIEKVDCKICHPKESKKVRNDYGKAFGKALGKPNTKDAEKINEAYDAVAKEKSSDGKTYGELIESGKRPSGD